VLWQVAHSICDADDRSSNFQQAGQAVLIWQHCYEAWIRRNQALDDQNPNKNLPSVQFPILGPILPRDQRTQVAHATIGSTRPWMSIFFATNLGNELAMNEHFSLSHVAQRHNKHHTGQPQITDVVTSTT
jgi:hypothetical protein